MIKQETNRRRVRKNFGKIEAVAEMPNLIGVQTDSYKAFLQEGVPVSKRADTGLQAVFKSIFPIHDFAGRGDLEFIKYELDTPKQIAEAFYCKNAVGLKGGMLVANPIPEQYAMDEERINAAIAEALAEADQNGVSGKKITPFLLDKVQKLTGGDSLESNIELVFNNAILASRIAAELCAIKEENK